MDGSWAAREAEESWEDSRGFGLRKWMDRTSITEVQNVGKGGARESQEFGCGHDCCDGLVDEL